jgi:hypothetical protein
MSNSTKNLCEIAVLLAVIGFIFVTVILGVAHGF